MSARSKADSCWSLSLRGRGGNDGYSSDDDSEDDGKTAPTAGSDILSTTSDEARLLGELDLASRADTAAYKPNPWSIAKVNASARPPKPPAAAHKKPKPSSKATAKATVLDLLRTQPKKKHAPPRPTASVTAAAPNLSESIPEAMLSSTHSDSHPEDEAHIPSDETLVDVSYQPDVLVKPGKPPLVHTPSVFIPSSAARRIDFGNSSRGLVTRTGDVKRHPAPSSPSSSDLARSGMTSKQAPGLAGHQFASNAPHIPSPAGALPKPTSPPLLRDGPRQDLRSAMFKQSRPAANTTSDVIGLHTTETQLVTTVLPSSSYQSASTSRSPGKPTSFLRPGDPHSAKHVPFVAYIQSYHHQTPTGVSETQPWKREWRSPDLHSLPSRGRAFHQPSPPRQAPPLLPKREYSPVLPETSAYNHEREKLQGAAASDYPKPWLQRALDASTTSHSSRAASVTIPPPVKMLPLAIKRSASPSPPPPPSPPYCPSPPARRREQPDLYAASKKPQPKRNAYDAFGSPHASWSTLPAKKPRATGKDTLKTGRVVASGKFKIPPKLALASKGRFAREDAGKENGALGQAGDATRRKVTVYLPPPPKNAPGGLQGDDHSETASGHRGGMSAAAAPPPSSPGFRPLTIRRAVPPTMTLPAYKYEAPRAKFSPRPAEAPAQQYHDTQSSPGPSHILLSPVASPSRDRAADDLQDWRDNTRACLTFDEAGVSHRYRSVRRGVAERKRLSAEVWNILGLPSCGVVFHDKWRRTPSDPGSATASSPDGSTGMVGCPAREIVIVVWEGLTAPRSEALNT
ncbi:hypothetical protein TRAPUB_8612 [Trametes pubescens]|uniref:Uncharacterized protein n=1 Tax=Trametes pubescens TaxID=154538 RepID=A0A1M2W4N9_TRAPU|nr:hypothetical protein TRAPUB_8612 [Trametes pubescens]